jgi:hypothetical protein
MAALVHDTDATRLPSGSKRAERSMRNADLTTQR